MASTFLFDKRNIIIGVIVIISFIIGYYLGRRYITEGLGDELAFMIEAILSVSSEKIEDKDKIKMLKLIDVDDRNYTNIINKNGNPSNILTELKALLKTRTITTSSSPPL